MRIDNYTNIPLSGKTDVDDLMNRLNPGDVIRAKVLEITSDEAILKLFDGTVMRAKMLEAMNTKAGETVMLTVSSKSEGTLYLESAKNLSQMIEPNPETLNKLLETLQIKPDTQNLQIAAELMKAGAPVTTEHLEQSASLISSTPGLDAEKAVYITLKGLTGTDQAGNELLMKLLDGDLKLGNQLKDIQALMDKVVAAKSGQKGNEANYITQNAAAMDDQTAGAPANNTVGISGNKNYGISDNHNTKQTLQAQAVPITSASNEVIIAGRSAASSENTAASENIAASKNTAASENTAAFGTSTASSSEPSQTTSAPPSAVTYSASATGPKVQHAVSEGDRNSASATSSAGAFSRDTLPLADRFSKLIEAVRDLFVETDSDRLASELDVNKFKSEIYERLDVLKAAIQSSEGYDSKEMEGLFKATVQIDDTLKLLNQMNSNNIMYYQLPVSLAGRETTAELYIMKRQKNKKKIDPYNTVMFISLDTNHIGRIETLIDVKSNNVTVNLRTQSKQINDFIKGQIKDLYNGLAACGYKLVGIRYAVIDSETPLIQQERLLSGIVNKNYGKVDYRI